MMMEGGTTTLADSLLDDLDDLSDVEEQEDHQQEEENNEAIEGKEETNNKTANDHGDLLEESTLLVGAAGNVSLNGDEAFKIVPKRKRLLEDSNLKRHLEAIRKNARDTNGDNHNSKKLRKEQEEQEHHLILNSNKHLSNLAQELSIAKQDLCQAYHPKFPELEELIVDPLQYMKAVRCIWNEMDITKVSDTLDSILTSNQIITITVAGSTTSGRMLTPHELQVVDDAAAYLEQVTEIQQELRSFVEGRMECLAPNVCALIGPSTAAKVLGLAGGLAELSKIPACNLQVLGQTKHSATSRAGLSGLSTKPHTGILVECDLVQRCPSYLQKKALKTVAAKLALAARCDFVNVDTGRVRTSQSGRQFRSDIEQKIQKWEEPDKARTLKALPKPDLTIKKRRGGKRIRRLKEKFEETEMMKQANTRAFSVQTGEYADDAMGLTMGMLDTQEGGGNVRRTTEKRKMRQANTKASRKRAAAMQQVAAGGSRGAAAASSSSSGLVSSMVFTPVQGLELVNPDANKDRVAEANRKWFSENAGFQSAIPPKKG